MPMILPFDDPQKAGFAPLANEQTRVLVLGSLPGEISLERRQYYANPTNQFWRLMTPVVGADLTRMDYQDRLAALLQAGVGLWDVIGSGKRSGSLDSAIRDYATNDLGAALEHFPSLRAFAFNGGKAFRIGQRQLTGRTQATLLPLPSSSAAYCAITFEAKLSRWREMEALLSQNSG